MADSKRVAKRDGPHRTNVVTLQTDELAPGYKVELFNQTEMTPTGVHKVLEIAPADKDAPVPAFAVARTRRGTRSTLT